MVFIVFDEFGKREIFIRKKVDMYVYIHIGSGIYLQTLGSIGGDGEVLQGGQSRIRLF